MNISDIHVSFLVGSDSAPSVELQLNSIEREVEGGTVFNPPFGPYGTSLAGKDALYRGQSNSGSGEFDLVMQPLEWLEQPIHAGRIEAGTIVADKVDHLVHVRISSNYLLGSKLDAGARMVRRILPGIAQQVIEYDAHQTRVGKHFRGVSYLKLDLACGVGGSEFDGNSIGERAEIHLGRLDRCSGSTREAEEIVDE